MNKNQIVTIKNLQHRMAQYFTYGFHQNGLRIYTAPLCNDEVLFQITPVRGRWYETHFIVQGIIGKRGGIKLTHKMCEAESATINLLTKF